ncbi:MAG: 16S rRNA processing protein RimM, partial [Anaerolineales bacterium]|nr:16S rRNA processing protein RimM [Anaerolineales bacterium]
MIPDLRTVGRVIRPHGVRGDLLLESLTDFPERLREVDVVYLGEAAEPHRLSAARLHRGYWIVRLDGCADRDCAEQYRGQLVQARLASAAPLPPGQYYHHQLLGLAVVTEAGEVLGELVEILETGANDVYVVRGPQGEILLPAIRSVIREINLETRQITAHLLDGLR